MNCPLKDRSHVVAYVIFVGLLALAGSLHLTTVVVTTLFAYLALHVLSFGKLKWVAIVLFVVLLAALFYGFALFVKHAAKVLPEIASTSIPIIVHYATEHGIDLPFTDVDSLKALAMDSVKETLSYLGNFAKLATKEFIFLIVGVVIAIGIFINPELDQDRNAARPNLYSLYCTRLSDLFASFYTSFQTVMGAQVIISGINTAITAAFVYAVSLPYAHVVVVLTFLCGLLPVIGNIISNTIITGIALQKSPQLAAGALVFLVAVHKFEYFLNSKIIGGRIRNPMWMTLIALVVGERLFGIAGIVLAPVALNFIKIEASKYEAPPRPPAA